MNRQLAEDPRNDIAHFENADEFESILRDTPADRVVLVDSLSLSDAPQAEILAACASTHRIGLLAHSLPSLIPGPTTAGRRAHLAVERRFLEQCVGAIAPSRFMARALVGRGLPAERAHLVAPAPICDGRDAVAGASRGDSSAHRAIPQILTVANWHPAKGIVTAAEALTALTDLPWHWTLIGEKDHDSTYTSLVLKTVGRRLGGRVTVRPAMQPQELHRYYATSDLFLLPTYMESYGLVFAEALTHGLPILAHDCAAVREVLGSSGILTPAGDRKALIDALVSVLSPEAKAGTRRAHLRSQALTAAASLPRWQSTHAAFARALTAISRDGGHV